MNYPEFQGKLSLWRATQTQVPRNSERGFNEEGISQRFIDSYKLERTVKGLLAYLLPYSRDSVRVGVLLKFL